MRPTGSGAVRRRRADMLARRRQQAAPSAKERILTTADRLFYRHGIQAVGVQWLIEESQVTRVTLYRHFPSKDDLILAYLDRRAHWAGPRISAGPHRQIPGRSARCPARLGGGVH